MALDYMVAVLEGMNNNYIDYFTSQWHLNKSLRYSTNRDKGGDIIEREGITTSKTAHGFWEAYIRPSGVNEGYSVGDTPLIAGIQCYVASKLGDTVEVPDSIIKVWKHK